MDNWFKAFVLLISLAFVAAESVIVANALSRASAACKCGTGVNTGAVIGEVR